MGPYLESSLVSPDLKTGHTLAIFMLSGKMAFEMHKFKILIIDQQYTQLRL